MIKAIGVFSIGLIWCFITITSFICLILLVVSFAHYIFTNDTSDKIEPMPFDSRLCTNTGKMHRYIVIGEKGAVIERYEPILDCTNLDKYNGDLK